MKKLFILSLLLLSLTTAKLIAQDVIVKKDNTTILSKVLEINDTNIKYKKWSNQDGPTYSINIADVMSINYQNGEVEKFSVESVEKSVKPYQTNQQSNVNKPKTGGYMKRDGDKLLLNGRQLSDNEVKELVGEVNYNTYKGAQKNIHAKDEFKITCKGEQPYYCEDDGVCCKYKYYDRHGTCWSTMNGCRSTGYACVICHIQD